MPPKKKHETVHAALLAVQTELTAPPKDGMNPAFGHKYTTLGTLISHVRPLLQAHNLLIFIKHHAGEQDTAELTLHHIDSGTSISSEMSLIMERKNNWAQGSACTYSARYLIESMLMLPGIDDDGASACVSPKQEAANPLLAIANPEKMVEAIVNEAGKNDPESDPKGWSERIKLIDSVLAEKGWEDHPLVIATYLPIKTAVNLHLQGKEVF